MRGPGSSVVIVTAYGLDGPGSNPILCCAAVWSGRIEWVQWSVVNKNSRESCKWIESSESVFWAIVSIWVTDYLRWYEVLIREAWGSRLITFMNGFMIRYGWWKKTSRWYKWMGPVDACSSDSPMRTRWKRYYWIQMEYVSTNTTKAKFRK